MFFRFGLYNFFAQFANNPVFEKILKNCYNIIDNSIKKKTAEKEGSVAEHGVRR
jgi:hypothetical protein